MPPTPLIVPGPNSGPLPAWPFQGAQSLTNPVTLINGAPLTLQDGQGNTTSITPGAVATGSSSASGVLNPSLAVAPAPTLVTPGAVTSFSIPLAPGSATGLKVRWLAAVGSGTQEPLYAFFNADNAADYHYTYEEISDGGASVSYGETEAANGGGSFRVGLCTPTGSAGSAGEINVPFLRGLSGFSLSGTAHSSWATAGFSHRGMSLSAWMWAGAGPLTSVGFLLSGGGTFTTNSQFAVSYIT